jgi:hypothetical protein
VGKARGGHMSEAIGSKRKKKQAARKTSELVSS